MVEKTNVGTKFHKHEKSLKEGNPSLLTKRSRLGTIVDIKFPDVPFFGKPSTQGLQVIIQFDDPKLGTPKVWFTLSESYETVIASIGNRDAVLAKRPRISYSYHPSSFYQGIAKIICDNNTRGSYENFQSNPTNEVVATLSSTATGTKPVGLP